MKTRVRTYEFPLGNFNILVLQDGIRPMENPGETFGMNQTPETVAALLEANFLPADKSVNGFSPVLVDTGSQKILFDTGFGEAGREAGSGKLLEGLAQHGITPEDVTIVVLTHLHGDHISGLMEQGRPTFPNARYVTGEAEYAFWKDPARAGTPAEGNHQSVLKNVVPLEEKLTFLNEGSEVVPGITAHEAFGHTPGHMIFRVESAGKALMLTADTANHFVLSLQRPDWEVRFDMDKQAAAASRHKVFDQIAEERIPFIGYHMPFPSVGYAEKLDEGFRFVPVAYQFDAQ
nr:MBL fold metallo-hydrolase [Limoniibacter endophyticus]